LSDTYIITFGSGAVAKVTEAESLIDAVFEASFERDDVLLKEAKAKNPSTKEKPHDRVVQAVLDKSGS
jgi:hypothetical protein